MFSCQPQFYKHLVSRSCGVSGINFKQMTREEIDNVICQIMIKDGPDRHVDGHDVITDFIIALQEGNEYEWKAKYWSDKNISEDEW